jgi:hypothetical protein
MVQFTLPLTSTSIPNATPGTASDAVAVALDSNGDLAAANPGGDVLLFNAPVTSSSAAVATFKYGTPPASTQLVFNSSGDLFAVGGVNTVNRFTHPLTSASMPSQVITSTSLTNVMGVALDAAGKPHREQQRPNGQYFGCFCTAVQCCSHRNVGSEWHIQSDSCYEHTTVRRNQRKD